MKEYPNGQHVPRVLVVEDDKTQLRALGDVLEEEGFEVVGCATASEALDHLDRRQVDVAVVNLRPPDLSEGSLLEDLGAFSEDVPIIVHTRHSSYASVREAIRWVAFAYVEKSGAPDELVCHVHRAVQIHLAQRAEMLEAAVTEQKRAEQAVQRERDRAQMYLDIAGVMLVALDVEGRVTLMNRRGCEIVGLEQHQVLGRDWCDTFVPERDRRHVKEVFANLMAGEVEPVERSENPVLRADGAERLIAWHNRRLQDEEGRIIGTLSSGEDVTELRESHRRLEERLAELDHLYETSPLGLGVFDTNQRYTRVNSMLAAINGHPASEHIGRTPSEVIPELAPQIEPMLRRVIETGQADFDFELHGTTPAEPGMGKDWLGCYYPITSPGGKLLGVGIAVRDITNRKKAENELLAREERMRLAVQNVPVLVSAFDENGKLIVWNRECERVTGYTRDEMIGNPRAL